MKTLAFPEAVEGLRNDGVTGSNPVSGTTLPQGKSAIPLRKAFRLGAIVGPCWGALAWDMRRTVCGSIRFSFAPQSLAFPPLFALPERRRSLGAIS